LDARSIKMACGRSSLLKFIGVTVISQGQDLDGSGQIGHATALGYSVEWGGNGMLSQEKL
jgi:hypothetical protein